MSVFTLFLNADYLALKDNNHCAADLVPNQDNSGWCYHDMNDDRDECHKYYKMKDFIDGYVFTDGKCVMKNDLRITGLTQDEWRYFMAVLAHVLGFTMLFLVSFLSVLTVRK